MFVKNTRVAVRTHMFDWAGIMWDDYGTVVSENNGRVTVQLDNGPLFLFREGELDKA